MNAKLKQFLKNSRLARPIFPILYGLKYSQFRPCPFFRFLWYNLFCRKVKIDWMNNGLVFPTPYSVVELWKGASIELHGPLIVGKKRLRKSRLETSLLMRYDAKLIVNKRFSMGCGTNVEVQQGGLLQVDHGGTNCNCTIICAKNIQMKGRVAIGRAVSIRDTNSHWIYMDGFKLLRPVVIENHTWICSGATISAGVKIREGAVVGACSYVIQNVPARTLVSGHPAKVVMRYRVGILIHNGTRKARINKIIVLRFLLILHYTMIW